MNRSTGSLVASILTIAAVPVAAQWLNVPIKGIPRTKDGKPDLSGPAPRTPDGKPDLSGVWMPRNEKYAARDSDDRRDCFCVQRLLWQADAGWRPTPVQQFANLLGGQTPKLMDEADSGVELLVACQFFLKSWHSNQHQTDPPAADCRHGSPRERYQAAQEIQCYSGIAPVVASSGQQRWVHWRWPWPRLVSKKAKLSRAPLAAVIPEIPHTLLKG